jgi:hypothetical protein
MDSPTVITLTARTGSSGAGSLPQAVKVRAVITKIEKRRESKFGNDIKY